MVKSKEMDTFVGQILDMGTYLKILPLTMNRGRVLSCRGHMPDQSKSEHPSPGPWVNILHSRTPFTLMNINFVRHWMMLSCPESYLKAMKICNDHTAEKLKYIYFPDIAAQNYGSTLTKL